MKFSYAFPLDRPAAAVWRTAADTGRLIRCIPGVESVEPGPAGTDGAAGEDGAEVYRVRMGTSLGPVRLRGTGTARVRRNPAGGPMTGNVSLGDARAGPAYATMAFAVHAAAENKSELRLELDVALTGKIGVLARPVLRLKADRIAREFVRNLTGMM